MAIAEAFGAAGVARLLDLRAEPLGSGCIAQVHAATLAGGEAVAIKVLHPRVEQAVADDLYLMRTALAAMHLCLRPLVPGLRWLALTEALDEFSQFMSRQLDLRHEADNLERFGRDFAGDARIAVPTPVRVRDGAPSLVSRRVLVESFVPGVTLSRMLDEGKRAAEAEGAALALAEEEASAAMQAAAMGASTTAEDDAKTAIAALRALEAEAAERAARDASLARLGLRTFLSMLLRHNFVHADLHPGNLLVMPGQDAHGRPEPRLGLLDAGLVVELSERDRRNFLALFRAIGEGDGERAAELMLTHAREQRCTEPEAFKAGMRKLVASARAGERGAFNLRNVQIGEVLLEVTNLVRTYRVQADPAFTTLVCAIVVLEGLGRQLDPSLDLFSVALPILIGIS